MIAFDRLVPLGEDVWAGELLGRSFSGGPVARRWRCARIPMGCWWRAGGPSIMGQGIAWPAWHTM